MKIELDINRDGINIVQAYSEGSFVISNINYKNSIILSPEIIFEKWPPESIKDLKREDLNQVISLQPEIVIIGTGNKLVFPETAVLKPLTDARIGIEIMDTGAACRSYNFLVGEGRKVVAALIAIKP
jgi:uncharacterized protein